MLRIRDADNFRRTLAGLCLIAAPLVLLVAMIVHGGGGDAGLVKTLVESPGRVQAANLLIMFSSVLFVPALIGLLGLVRGRTSTIRRHPREGAIAQGSRRYRNQPAGDVALEQIRVLIADDHPHFREGLRALLLSASDLEVVGGAGTGGRRSRSQRSFSLM
jgi:hypothetical protein